MPGWGPLGEPVDPPGRVAVRLNALPGVEAEPHPGYCPGKCRTVAPTPTPRRHGTPARRGGWHRFAGTKGSGSPTVRRRPAAPGGAVQCLWPGGIVLPAVSPRALTGALTNTEAFLPSLASITSVTSTVSPAFTGDFRSISITW
jgi:hypothetical protein